MRSSSVSFIMRRVAPSSISSSNDGNANRRFARCSSVTRVDRVSGLVKGSDQFPAGCLPKALLESTGAVTGTGGTTGVMGKETAAGANFGAAGGTSSEAFFGTSKKLGVDAGGC